MALVPIAVEALKLGEFPRHHLGQTKRPGAGGRQHGDASPIAATLLEGGRRRDEEIDRHKREIGCRLLGGDRNRKRVDLAIAAHQRHPRPAEAGARRIELRTVILEVAIEIPDHGIGVEIRPIMKLHAAP